MHYKNGREAKIGDQILVDNKHEGKYIGMIVSITPRGDTCNAQVVPLPIPSPHYVTLGEVLHVDDALLPEAPPTDNLGTAGDPPDSSAGV